MICFCKAQVSLEYLLLLAALLSVFSVFLISAGNLYQLGLFAVDTRNAQVFSDQLENQIDLLGLLSDGSKKELPASPVSEWEIFYENGFVNVMVENKKLEQSKTFSFPTTSKIRIINSKIGFGEKVILEKKSGIVLIENS